ncbi:MAG TPA: hypothetical protein VM425_11630 [Myxococcota bacterium]|nr:hypothetical protein [Myxococcota bacterium]
MSQTSARGWKKHLLRRTLPLTLLAAAVALTGIQMLSMIPHDVTARIEIAPRHIAGLEIAEIFVTEGSDENLVLSAVQFRFDTEHRPAELIEHTFSLTNGNYILNLRLTREDGTQVNSRRRITVSGEMSLVLPAL